MYKTEEIKMRAIYIRAFLDKLKKFRFLYAGFYCIIFMIICNFQGK